LEHIINATIIIGDKIIIINDGHPSGDFMTAWWNSMCVIIMTLPILLFDLNIPEDHFEMAIYGDDNVITLDEPGLRCSDFTPHYKRRFDMDYTHWSKDKSETFDSLTDIKFLGRKFVYLDSYWRAPLDLETILESAYWLHGLKDREQNMLSVTESIFEELSHYPPSVFYEYTELYLKAMEKRFPQLYPIASSRLRTYNFYFNRKYTGSVLSKSHFK
jgi:hypothetical protein